MFNTTNFKNKLKKEICALKEIAIATCNHPSHPNQHARMCTDFSYFTIKDIHEHEKVDFTLITLQHHSVLMHNKFGIGNIYDTMVIF